MIHNLFHIFTPREWIAVVLLADFLFVLLWGRFCEGIEDTQTQCPRCGWVNSESNLSCDQCRAWL